MEQGWQIANDGRDSACSLNGGESASKGRWSEGKRYDMAPPKQPRRTRSTFNRTRTTQHWWTQFTQWPSLERHVRAKMASLHVEDAMLLDSWTRPGNGPARCRYSQLSGLQLRLISLNILSCVSSSTHPCFYGRESKFHSWLVKLVAWLASRARGHVPLHMSTPRPTVGSGAGGR